MTAKGSLERRCASAGPHSGIVLSELIYLLAIVVFDTMALYMSTPEGRTWFSPTQGVCM